MLLDEIKKRFMAAMKAQRTVEKEVLRVVIGEITTAEARTSKLEDADAQAIIRKLVKSNEETLAASESAEQQQQLEEELIVLRSLLPATLDVEAIVAALAPVLDAIRAAKNDGQATGVAMKHLKGSGALVEGKDVGAAVARLRA
jgi:uncharacterized protein YqeY